MAEETAPGTPSEAAFTTPVDIARDDVAPGPDDPRAAGAATPEAAEDKPAPIDATARRAHKMIPNSRLIEYEGHPHGFYATNSDQMVEDTLAFVQQ